MKSLLPRRHEWVIFAVMAVVCTLVVSWTGKYDLGLALLGAPVFLVAALMGLGRSTEAAAAQADDSDDVTPA